VKEKFFNVAIELSGIFDDDVGNFFFTTLYIRMLADGGDLCLSRLPAEKMRAAGDGFGPAALHRHIVHEGVSAKPRDVESFQPHVSCPSLRARTSSEH
jgi:hypothetical protein